MNCDINGHVTHESGDKYPCADGVQDVVAMKRYVSIFKIVRSYNMIIALTLFHHSLPKYYNKPSFGGWTNSSIIPYFVAFTKDVVSYSAHLVDRYIVLNEYAVYANLVYGTNQWP